MCIAKAICIAAAVLAFIELRTSKEGYAVIYWTAQGGLRTRKWKPVTYGVCEGRKVPGTRAGDRHVARHTRTHTHAAHAARIAHAQSAAWRQLPAQPMYMSIALQGGVSKATKGLNLSEDVFTGMEAVLRGQTVVHREYYQVGSGPTFLIRASSSSSVCYPHLMSDLAWRLCGLRVRSARDETWDSSQSSISFPS